MSELVTRGVSRRGFVAGAAAGAVAVGAAGVKAQGAFGAEGSAKEGGDAQEYACDIVVVGSGSAGLTACVQAAELGASVVCVERAAVVGGNGRFTDGMFGLDSTMEKEQGIVADGGALIREELELSQFRGSGVALSAMVKASGENIDWLMEQGVTFTCVEHGTFHNFSGGYNRGGYEHYAQPMEAKALELGVQFLTETLATGLSKSDDGAGWVVEAEGPDGAVRVTAKAAILAGGGFVRNKELMQEYFDIDIDTEVTFMGDPGPDGSTIQMALDAGAKSNMGQAGVQGHFQVVGLPQKLDGGHFSAKIERQQPYVGIWVNQDAKRFVNEDCGESNWALPDMATRQYPQTYTIIDEAMYETFVEGLSDQPGKDVVDAELEQGIEIGQIFRADTIEGLAEAAGLDPEVLCATVDNFNAMVEAGSDTEFGKKLEYMQPFATPPYIAISNGHLVICSFGGVKTDLDGRAVDEAGEPIPGLYSVGVDGAMLWANEYTLALPGGTNANNIHSGRMAARSAVAYIAG